jgi:hypothetical protein
MAPTGSEDDAVAAWRNTGIRSDDVQPVPLRKTNDWAHAPDVFCVLDREDAHLRSRNLYEGRTET